MMKVKIGTRSSKLALWQAYHIQELLSHVGVESELVTFETKGDKILDKSLSKIGSKGLFTEELETSLLKGETHIAVHSAKDLPSSLPDELEIISFTEREDTQDVLVSEKDLSVADSIVVGTSSTRRVALLKHFYPHLEIVPMRGNLQTRVAKMQNGDCDALMLAYAGVKRMGYDHLVKHHFSQDEITPPVGQGALALEASKKLDLKLKDKIIEACSEKISTVCLTAERSFLKVMNGGCSVPIFAFATVQNENVQMKGGIVSLDGKEKINVSGNCPISEADKLGKQLADELLTNGGLQILNEIKTELNL